jgi:hypothetical protein
MQVLLVILGMAVFALVGFLIMICASPYSRRCWAIWLLTTANAMDEIRAAKHGIEDERRRRENEMRQSYGIIPVGTFQARELLNKRG